MIEINQMKCLNCFRSCRCEVSVRPVEFSYRLSHTTQKFQRAARVMTSA